MAYFIISLIVYLFLHSLFAHDSFKAWSYRNFISEKYYRLFFSTYAILFLIPVYYFYFQVDSELIFEPSIFMIALGFIIAIFSIFLFALAFKVYKLEEFIGWDRLSGEHAKNYPLNIKGLNGITRHPLYTYSYSLMFGLFLMSPTYILLFGSLLIGIYMPIGIYFEEQKLIKEYGQEYAEYTKNVPKLIPKIKKNE